ncbi:[protein-PII] uridylyltransferase [Frigidibacter sp. MR17.24]|uniref:[protein-PII] uridylyltransferase n=1 Tax=Frigidibacter sp. MR17.24 TaxID=3127345 RepID=UPI003012F7F9
MPPSPSAATAPDTGADSAAIAALPFDALFDRGPPEPLMAAAQRLVDQAIATARAEGVTQLRAPVVQVLGALRTAGRARIAAEFRSHPRTAAITVRAYAQLTDVVVITAFRAATRHLHPLPNPTGGQKLAVVAVGGYGRAEMAPESDVDLLFLSPWKITGWAESVIESMLYMLWDLKLKVGHASRTVDECLRLGAEDVTIRTALLENRFLVGETALAEEMQIRLRAELFRRTGPQFIEAKLGERAQRHSRQGGQRYVLEPNVKEGKGGLRDLQTLYWIAKYLHGVDEIGELVEIGLFTRDEYRQFDYAEDFLWAVRCHLHLLAGRAMDQLTFDMQIEVASAMGFEDRAGRRGVELFMQHYFRYATKVGEITRIFLTALEARHVKKAPKLEGLFKRRKKVKPGYRIDLNRLNIENPKAFLSDKLNLLRIFDEALRTGFLIHPDAMRLVAANLQLIDETVRDNAEASAIFLDLMLKHGNPERALRRMNELGVLSAYIPEFEPIVAMMQFNVYHHYTVDEHIIQCISTLDRIERGELTEDLPLSSAILKAGVNRRVLYVALLLHDIGKGRPEDHSVIGAQIARRVAPRLGLDAEEVETVEWLVRYHLFMSDVAQKRDLSDPRTLRDFVKAVKTRKRLDLLTVLTVCDIRGVGPNTWNGWKAALLRRLYRLAGELLDSGVEEVVRDRTEDEAKAQLRAALAFWPAEKLDAEIARHYPPYWQALGTEGHLVFARLLDGLKDDEIRIDLMPDLERDATRVSFVMVDHPGIFSRLSGALALVGANVVDARTDTTKDGYAAAVFWVQDAEAKPYEAGKLPRLRTMIGKTLKGEVRAREALTDRDRLKKRERAFSFPTNISFDNEGSDIYTIIEVDTRDRPGLLYDLTRTLASNNIYIASAVIATYGAQVVDTFYVKDTFGLKLFSPARQEALERRLRAAIAAGAERAQNGA